jgi:hypothetical protein
MTILIGVWASLAGLILVVVFLAELGAVRSRMGGANGCLWLAAHVIVAASIPLVSAVVWLFDSGHTALMVLGFALLALVLEAVLTMMILKWAGEARAG